ncbi:MAG: hypothetical protein CNIPEHKO_02212 [Anaerolineales bacterium]|nr:hypothetical protein [Anaerolineales bacterium]
MKTWTKRQYLTYILLFALIFVDFSRSLFILIVRDVLDSSVRQTYDEQLRTLEPILYAIQVLGSFPILVLVLSLNRDRLQEMNIDRFYVVLLIISGLIVLYAYRYEFLAVIGLICAFHILFSDKVRFGVIDFNGLRVMLLVVGVFVGVQFCMYSFSDVINISPPSSELLDRFLFRIIPGSIYEEAMYRGVLYMFLMDVGVGKSKAFYIQAFLFSFKHISYLLVNPFFFWVGLPISSLAYGYIAMRSKSLTPSTFAHLLYNTLVVYGIF